jgi:outer membrane lipoprotein-sorting protein
MYHQLRRLTAVAVIAAATCGTFGCSGGVVVNSNSGNSNTVVAVPINANVTTAGATPNAAAGTPLTTREPENYSVQMTLTASAAANNQQGSTPPIQFNFAKMGQDKRWEFKNVIQLGNVIYLEKSGLKYVILPSQNQYAEINQDELGIPLGTMLTPTAAIEQLRSRGQFQDLGVEPVSNRPANKYRFAAAAATGTQAGTAQADSLIFIDQETGLPLRVDLDIATSGGQTARITTMTENIQINPEATMFDVPTGMKKVTTQELKQKIQTFALFIRAAAQMLGQQVGAAPPAQ